MKKLLILVMLCAMIPLFTQTTNVGSDALDVRITAPSDGERLAYQSSTRRWINTAGGTFTTITMSDEGWIGLGAAKGRLVFNDEATDLLEFKDCTVDVDGAFTASSVVSDGLITGTAITGSTEANFTNNAAAVTFGLVTTDADVVLAFDAVTTQGSITFMEDEDRFDFDNDVHIVNDLYVNNVLITPGDNLDLGNYVIDYNTGGTGGYHTITADCPNLAAFLFWQGSGTDYELNASTGTQYFMNNRMRVDQSGDAAFVGLGLTMLEEDVGSSGGSYITCEAVGGATEFKVDLDGTLYTYAAQYGEITTPDLTGNTYTTLSTDYHVNIDDDDAQVSATVVVTLPAVATSDGRILTFKKIGNSYNVQLDGNASEEIDDSTTQTMTSQYDSITIMCDGTAWWIQ